MCYQLKPIQANFPDVLEQFSWTAECHATFPGLWKPDMVIQHKIGINCQKKITPNFLWECDVTFNLKKHVVAIHCLFQVMGSYC